MGEAILPLPINLAILPVSKKFTMAQVHKVLVTLSGW